MIDVKDTKYMPVAVYQGGNGALVLRQEWPSVEYGERYMSIVLDMKDAEKLAMNILFIASSVAVKAKEENSGQNPHHQA